VGIARLAIGQVAIFRELRTTAAIIQWNQLSQEFLSRHILASLGLAVIAFGLAITTSPLVALFSHQPKIGSIVRLLAAGSSSAPYRRSLGVVKPANGILHGDDDRGWCDWPREMPGRRHGAAGSFSTRYSLMLLKGFLTNSGRTAASLLIFASLLCSLGPITGRRAKLPLAPRLVSDSG
jgi:hypothetical protein